MINEIILRKIIEECKQYHVEKLRDKTLDLLINLINENNIKNILEIGTGVGYSSYMINNLSNHRVHITTIEKDESKYKIAKQNLAEFKDTSVINVDCFAFSLDHDIDLLILDGPKRHQIDLINQFKSKLTKNGLIFIDNLFLNKFRLIENKTNNQENILNDLDQLINWIKNQHEFNFKILNIDDGIGLLLKK